MAFFQRDRGTHTDRGRRLYAIYELVYTSVDVGAALFFLVGSILFFYDSLKIPATWCFVLGSVLFAVKPLLRIVREIHLASEGDLKDLAQRYKGS